MRFNLRTLFVLVAVAALLIAAAAWFTKKMSNTEAVIAAIEKLHGAVNDDSPPTQLWFNCPGLKPLVTDSDLLELAPRLAALDIKYVQIARSKITDAGVKTIVDYCFRTLEDFDLHGTAITSESLNELSRCRQLQTLVRSQSLLTDDAIRAIVAMPHLKQLLLFGDPASAALSLSA
jgi:hypothetical protein